ncbi:hypothetical protein FOMPIDRAFT_1055260 [Fomitopsis schrenkii]|uniref:Uncharacterized protein n=1 Tax=Fomitopsis schrenkii TaxID=2126942 RepID=S8F5S2_FOMSC|nr:hypothetical protein FOMPIDRAFT_1055260 [Fomitopsis schrenkii]
MNSSILHFGVLLLSLFSLARGKPTATAPASETPITPPTAIASQNLAPAVESAGGYFGWDVSVAYD